MPAGRDAAEVSVHATQGEADPSIRAVRAQAAAVTRIWTEAGLLEALRADMRRPWRPSRRRSNIQRNREEVAAAAAAEAAAVEEAETRARRRSKRFTEKRPGQLRAIRIQLRAGDSRGLSVEARRMLVLIARRPDVIYSRKWTTAKASRVTINADALRSHFHHWAASVARNAAKVGERLKAERAAAERARQDDVAYQALEAAHEREDRAQERLYERGLPPAVDVAALARLVDRAVALREDERLEALELKELEDVPPTPWIALDDVSLRVLPRQP